MDYRRFTKKLSTLKKVLLFVYKRYTSLALGRDFLCLLSTFAEILSITILGKFIDSTMQILTNWSSFDLNAFFVSDSFIYLILIFALWVVIQICTQTRENIYSILNERINYDCQYEIIDKISESNLEDVEEENFQDMVTYAPQFSIPKIIEVYDHFSIILTNIIRLIVAFVILSDVMGMSVFFIILFILPEIVIIHIRRRQLRGYRDENIGKLKFLNYIQNLAVNISSFEELRINNVFSYIKRKYKTESDEYVGGLGKSLDSFYRDKTIVSVFGQILKFIYIIFVLAKSVALSISLGTFKALYDYVDVAYSSIFYIFNSSSLILINLGYIDHFFDLVNFQCFGDKYNGEKLLGAGTPVLEFRNLNFAYPDDTSINVLKNLNIEIKPGEKVAFFGGDGSGKSTVVKILTGLYKVEDGEYFLNGIPTKELKRGELKKKLSTILQEFIYYNFSVKENIVISGQRKNVDVKSYEEVARTSGVEKMKSAAHIDDTSILGKTFPNGKELSPGYWQRLAIARMLYRNKSIFIMDEPFTYIDDFSAEKILNQMFRFIGNDRSAIYITRSLKFLDKFDRIYYFEKGRIVESGTWNELVRRKGKLYDDYKKSTE